MNAAPLPFFSRRTSVRLIEETPTVHMFETEAMKENIQLDGGLRFS